MALHCWRSAPRIPDLAQFSDKALCIQKSKTMVFRVFAEGGFIFDYSQYEIGMAKRCWSGKPEVIKIDVEL